MDNKKLMKFSFFKLRGNVKKWIHDLSSFSKREAKETSVSSKIFSKMILSYFNLSKEKPTPEEIKFLQSHSKDLLKIVAFIATRPTPIPYILIAVILKRFNVNLLPSKDDLKIPDKYNK